MSGYNTIEEYNAAYRKQLKDNWESEIRLYKNWLDGHRSYHKVGWLAGCHNMTDTEVKRKLDYANNILNNLDYLVQSHSYSYKKPKSHKDNDGSFTSKYDYSHSDIIRVPSLKRKTAWKRFYKMYPQLKGKKSIPGRSSCYAPDVNGDYKQTIQHESTIKLKKIKKH